jgi:hypothetical protein
MRDVLRMSDESERKMKHSIRPKEISRKLSIVIDNTLYKKIYKGFTHTF